MVKEYDSEYIRKIVGWLEEQEARMQKGVNLYSK
jgi:hypothetical protein